MDFDRYGMVKCSKIEGMLPKLMNMVGGEDEEYEINSMAGTASTGLPEMVAMVSQNTGQ